VIGRRELVGAAALGGLLATAAAAEEATADTQTQIDLVHAFYRAGNQDNWAFVDRIFSDTAVGQTNDQNWFDWNSKEPFKKLSGDWRDMRQHGRFENKAEIYAFLRHRQYKSGWYWSLPEGKNSVFSPKRSTVIGYSEWNKKDGDCWGEGVFCMAFQPRFIHQFEFSVDRELDVTVGTKIIGFTEINLKDFRIG
jgi:hypothetical protein